MTYTRHELVSQMASKTGHSTRDAKQALECILSTINASLTRQEMVKICGFGRWFTRQKRQRQGRNPITGERIEITPRTIVSFDASTTLRKAMKRERNND